MNHRTTLVAAGLLLALPLLGCKSSNPQEPDAQASAADHTGAEHASCGEPGHDCAEHAAADATADAAPTAFDSAPAPGTTARCPVAGKSFTVAAGTATSEHNGKHYAFCCPGCKAKFDAEPDKYAAQ